MRAVIQRVLEARVFVGKEMVGEIGKGLLVFVGVGKDDDVDDCRYLADKIVHLRIFGDRESKLNLSVLDIKGAILVVSQFTLWGDCRRGRRPSFGAAAPPDEARRFYEIFVSLLKNYPIKVSTGRFQEMMSVHLVNDGPVTLLLDSKKLF